MATLPWHAQRLEQVFNQLEASPEGLSSSAAKERLKRYGPNRLSEERRFPWLRLFFRQVFTPFAFILLVATIVKLLTAGWIEGSVILITMILMILIGFVQEMKAEKTMAALKQLSAHRSKVKREGAWHAILSEHLVPGDIILLEMGDKVPADARLISVKNLKVNESLLTGESIPSEKKSEPSAEKTSLTERKNMVYSGTVVVYGRGEAVVTATAMQTEMGNIAQTIQEIAPEPSPLEKDLNSIGRWVIALIFATIGVFVVLGIRAGMSVVDVFLLGVAATVSAIPEGLPAAFAVTLAVGMHLMSRRNAIVRKMSTIETLGSTTVVCSDKTGTLTYNQMTVVVLHLAGETFSLEQETALYQKQSICRLAFDIAALCNDSRFMKKKQKLEFAGDPTETALLAAAAQMGADLELLLSTHPRIDEIPFTSESFYMATAHAVGGKFVLYLKGAPEKILSFSHQVLESGGVIFLDEKRREAIHAIIHAMSQKALRLIAVGYVELGSQISPLKEELFSGKLIFAGIFGMIDPPRKEAAEAIALCKKASIRVIMMTGDNPLTAKTIAKQLEIPANRVIAGKELSEIPDGQLAQVVEETSIFARLEPNQKLRIVRALQAKGHVVAMTGDGINDAPALEASNIGIAMGLAGSDVAKEVSDMILADDRFDSIVAAIEEGRAIFNRLRNVCALLICTSFGELIALILCVGSLKLAPLIPSQILWVNLIAGSLVAIPLGFEPKTGHEMLVPPRDPKSRLLYRGMLYRVLLIALLLGGGIFIMFKHLLLTTPVEKARSTLFTSMILFEWMAAIEMRSDEIPFWKLNPFKNKLLILIFITVSLVHLSILYTPAFQFLFQTSPLSFTEWMIALFPATALLILESFRKAFFPHLFHFGIRL